MAFKYENLVAVVLPQALETTGFDGCPRSPTMCDEATGAPVGAAHFEGWGHDGPDAFEGLDAIQSRLAK